MPKRLSKLEIAKSEAARLIRQAQEDKQFLADLKADQDYFTFVRDTNDRQTGANLAGFGIFVILLFLELVLLYAITGA